MAAQLKLVQPVPAGSAPAPSVDAVPTARETQPAANTAAAIKVVTPPEPSAAFKPESLWTQRARAVVQQVLPPIAGIAVLLLLWTLAAKFSAYLPGPDKTFAAAVTLFSDPFYQNGPNDQGIAWNLIASLERVAKGFGLALLVGVPLGFLIGRFAVLNAALRPIIGLFKPVAPLAWLPIGLALFQAASPAAIFTIFICAIWPLIINTALGVASVPQDYLNVARVLRLPEWKVFTHILLPASIPYVLTGAKLSLGIAWLAIVASEMLTGGTGIGFWLWDEWNNLNMEHILIAIIVIGLVGMLIEKAMTAIANRFDYQAH